MSPSALASYERCPQQFFAKYVARIAGADEPSASLCQGNAIHAALAKFFGLAPEERSLDLLHQALRQVWPEHRRPGAFLNDRDEANWGLEALAMLTCFHQGYDMDVVPLSREQWVSVRLENGMKLFGRADRIDSAADGQTIELVDYKTGKHQLDPDELRHDTAAQVYLLAVEAECRRPVSRVRFLYLASGVEIRWSPEREDVDAVRERLEELTTKLIASAGPQDFPAQPGWQCRFCPVAAVCPDKDRVRPEDLEPSEAVPF